MAADDAPITRTSTGEVVGDDEAYETWSAAAHAVLVDVARTYGDVVRHGELADEVGRSTSLTTRRPRRDWLGRVLDRVAAQCAAEGRPLLVSLCTRADGSMGPGYADIVARLQGAPPDDPEWHAAEERLACHRFHHAPLPPGGGRPQLPPKEQARRAVRRRWRQASTTGGGNHVASTTDGAPS